MIAMDKVHSIRQLFYEQGKSVSAIAAETGHDRKTISKYLDMTDFNTPEPKKEDPENMCPKLDAYKPLIDQWLLDDRKAPRKRKRKIASTLIFCVYHETGNSICQEQASTALTGWLRSTWPTENRRCILTAKSLICRSSTTPARPRLISAPHSSLKTVYPLEESIWCFPSRSAMPGISS